MQWFVDGLAWHAERHEVDVELVMVEWNPPEDRAPLSDVLKWPLVGSRLVARVLTVPAQVHRRLVGESTMPMLQMLAKNVGIRRSTADAVLATNIDVLLTDELFAAASGGIGSGAVWRADRYDVEFPFPPLADVAEALKFCRDHPIRYACRDGLYYPGSGRALPIYQSLNDLGSYEFHRGLRAVRTRMGGRKAPARPARPTSQNGQRPRTPSELASWTTDRLDALYAVASLPKLHVNASGDFTLLARSDWELLRGYPEWVVHSWHLDTVFLHQAHGSGFRFVELEPPCVVFHMEHGKGSGWTPEGHGEHMAKVASKGLKTLSAADLRREKRRFARHRSTGTAIVLNSAGWGLIDDEVVESRPR